MVVASEIVGMNPSEEKLKTTEIIAANSALDRSKIGKIPSEYT